MDSSVDVNTLLVPCSRLDFSLGFSRRVTEDIAISTHCPWFPEDGTLDIELWERAGKALKSRFEHGLLKDVH
ncbi:hypothetical protein KGF39_19455, partial [Clostridioides sp. ZZV14-6345]|nr:hypothetical protein [Clostridioides sp. ZZV14-6345]